MPKSLMVVLQLRERELDKASQQLQHLEQTLSTLKAQAQALEDYAVEYQQQLSAQGMISIQQRQVIATYLNQVQTAIIGQYEKIKQTEAQVDVVKKAWIDARVQVQAMEKLVDSRKKELRRKQEKQEQQAADALSQVQFVNKQH